jgi:hypothetical protein
MQRGKITVEPRKRALRPPPDGKISLQQQAQQRLDKWMAEPHKPRKSEQRLVLKAGHVLRIRKLAFYTGRDPKEQLDILLSDALDRAEEEAAVEVTRVGR